MLAIERGTIRKFEFARLQERRNEVLRLSGSGLGVGVQEHVLAVSADRHSMAKTLTRVVLDLVLVQ